MKTTIYKWILIALIVLGVQKINASIASASEPNNTTDTIMWYNYNEKEYTLDADVSIAHNMYAYTGTFISVADREYDKKKIFGYRDSLFWDSFIKNNEKIDKPFDSEYVPGIYVTIGDATITIPYFAKNSSGLTFYEGNLTNGLFYIECGKDKFFGTGGATAYLKGPTNAVSNSGELANGFFTGKAKIKVRYYENGAAEVSIIVDIKKDDVLSSGSGTSTSTGSSTSTGGLGSSSSSAGTNSSSGPNGSGTSTSTGSSTSTGGLGLSTDSSTSIDFSGSSCRVEINFKNYLEYEVYFNDSDITNSSTSTSNSTSTGGLGSSSSSAGTNSSSGTNGSGTSTSTGSSTSTGGLGSSSSSSSNTTTTVQKKFHIPMPLNYKSKSNDYENYDAIVVNGKKLIPPKTVITIDDFKNLLKPGVNCNGFKVYDDAYGTNNKYVEKNSLKTLSVGNASPSLIKCELITNKAETTYIYDTNGGKIESGVTGFTKGYGEMISSLAKPKREGYTFKGWYTAKTGGTKVTVSTKCMNTSDTTVTLYARWEKEIYTVVFKYGTKEYKCVSCNYNSAIMMNDVIKALGLSSSSSDTITLTCGSGSDAITDVKSPGSVVNVKYFADKAKNGTITINVSQTRNYTLTIIGANGVNKTIKKTDKDGTVHNLYTLTKDESFSSLTNNVCYTSFSFVTGAANTEIREWDVTKNPNLQVKIVVKAYERACSIPVTLKEESSVKGKCSFKSIGATNFTIKTTKPMGAPISTVDYEFADIDLKNNKAYSYAGIIPGFSYRSRTVSGSNVSYGITTLGYLEKYIYYDYIPAENSKTNIVIKGMIN